MSVAPLVLFDLDGTLVDSAVDLLNAINVLAAREGHAPTTLAKLRPVVSKGARAMLVESHEGDEARDYQSNTGLELVIADNAHVDHIKLTREGAKALHVSSLMADIGAHARFNSFVFTTGGAVVRNQLFLRFGGEGTVANIRGAL